MTLQRIHHAGAAAPTTLSTSITAGSTSLTVAAASGYPAAPFVIKLDAGTVSEEKVLVGAISGTTFSTLTRGYDGTSATSHSSGAAVEHDLAAAVVDDNNDHVYTTSRNDHTQYVQSVTAADSSITVGGTTQNPTVKANASGLLAVVSYNPGTQTTPSTLSTTPIKVDSTNLTVSFTAPSSGKVMVHLSCLGATAGTTSSGLWALLDHGTSAQYGSSVIVLVETNSVSQRGHGEILVTGLTPGTVYQMDWAYYSSSASLGFNMTYGGTSFPAPAVMEVFGL